MDNFWNHIYLNNTLKDWLIEVGIALAGIIILRLFKILLLIKLKRWSEKTLATLDDFIIKCFEKSVVPFLYFFIVYTSLTYLTLSDQALHIIHVMMMIITAFFMLKIITAALQYFVFSFLKTQENGSIKQKQAKGLLVILRVFIWMGGIVFLLDNLGYNVTSIIAGLGIGGIAIALAAQAILGDLFSYFVILFDQPFEIGDFITVDDKTGVVEYIGVKTTRLRALSGEQLICSNKDLTDSKVHNFKRMEKRRFVFTLGVTYQTSNEKLRLIPHIIKNIISNRKELLFDRGHFSGFGDFSLNFEFVYFILTPDYNIFMDSQQAIYYSIVEEFEKQRIEFAYPTQTIFLAKA